MAPLNAKTILIIDELRDGEERRGAGTTKELEGKALITCGYEAFILVIATKS